MTSHLIAEWQYRLTLGTAALLPLVFWPWALDNFNLPKLVVLAAVAIALLLLETADVVSTGSLRLPRGVAGGMACLFLGCALLSTVTAAVPWTAVLGPVRRDNGLVLYAACALVFLVVLRGMDRERVRGLLRAMLTGATLVALMVLAQRAGWQPWRYESQGVVEAFGTLGNPNFAAGLLAVALPLSGWQVWTGRGAGRLFGAGSFALLAAGTVATASLLGAVAGAAGLGVLLVVWLRSLGGRRAAVAVAVTAVGIGLAGVLGAGILELGPMGALGRQETVQFRRWYWSAAVQMGVERPLTGVGLGHYDAEYRSHRPVEAARRLDLEDEADAAHNVPLQMFAEGGVPLLVAHLAFLLTGAGALVVGLRRNAGADLALTGAAGGAFVAYAVQSWVSIDVPPLAFAGWLMCALAVVTSLRPRVSEWRLPWGRGERRPAKGARAVRRRRATLVVVSCVWLVSLWCIVVPLRASVHTAQGRQLAVAGRAEDAVRRTATAVGLASWRNEYWFEHARALLAADRDEDALRALDQAARRAPGDLGTALTAAEVAARLDRDEDAVRWYERALRIDPLSPDVKVRAAEHHLKAGRVQIALRLLRGALDVDPSHEDARALLARAERGEAGGD